MTEPATIPAAELLANLRQNTSDGVLRLASHAALPVVVDAGFVNLLRVNFFLDPPDELPFESEADLLLSPLCREIGDELYELDPAVRNLLLIMLQSRYGPDRVRQVALLLEQYTQSTPTWTAQPELEQAQQLTALSFIDPARAQSWLDDAAVGRRTNRLSHDWYVAMRARLAARPTPEAAQNELAAAIAALDDDSARVRLGAVNTLAVLSQLPGTNVTRVIDAVALMACSRANSRTERTPHDVQAALTLIGTVPRRTMAHNLSGIQLSRADLRNLNLRDCLMMSAGLYDCQADGISLDRANLYSADLVNVSADGASLLGANLSAARLTQVSLRGADLTGARLDGAILNDVDLSDANLTDAILPATTDYLVQRGVIFSATNRDEGPSSLAVNSDRAREQRADDLYQLAVEHEHSGNLAEAVAAAEEALQGFVALTQSFAPDSVSASNYWSKRIITLLLLSGLYGKQGNLGPAVEFVTDAIAKMRNSLPGGRMLAAALLSRSELHIQMGDLDSARRDAEESVEIYRELSAPPDRSWDLPDLARAVSVLATLFTDDHSETLARTFDEAIALYRESGPQFNAGLALTLLNQARWLMRIGRLPEADTAATEAMGLFAELRDVPNLVASCQTVGDITALLGNYSEATTHYVNAREYAQMAGRRLEEAIATFRLADAQRRLGNNDEALTNLNAATGIFLELDDVAWTAISQRNTGQLLDEIGRPAAAAEALRAALTGFQSLDDAPMSALTMSDLGHALLGAGQSQSAVGVLQDALGLIRRLVNPQAEATTLHRLGLALQSVGRLDEAIEALRNAAEIFRQVQDPQSEAQALDDLSRATSAAGQTGESPSSNPESYLAFYLVCDISDSMTTAIQALNFSLAELTKIIPGTLFASQLRLCVIGFSDFAYTFLPPSNLDRPPAIPALTVGGTADYGTVFDLLRLAIRNDVKSLSAVRPGSYQPIVFFVSASQPPSDNWVGSFRKLVFEAEPAAPPLIAAFGLGDADEDFISQVATSLAFMANPDTGYSDAVEMIIFLLRTSLIEAGARNFRQIESVPGFRRLTPLAGIDYEK